MAAELLKVNRLTVRFGGLTAVNDVDFSIFSEEIVSLIGPNGAGKTTTFNAITGFLSPSGGSIEFGGEELIRLKPHQIAERGITRTFQITSLFPNLSVLENIRTGHHIQERETLWDAFLNTRRKRLVEEETLTRAGEILQFIGLAGKKDSIAGSLPYGDQRILEIGIALAANPRLLLLDEPSAGLNDTETQGMKELIQKMRARSPGRPSSNERSRWPARCPSGEGRPRPRPGAFGTSRSGCRSSSSRSIPRQCAPPSRPRGRYRSSCGRATIPWKTVWSQASRGPAAT